jgi:hypothetical protein
MKRLVLLALLSGSAVHAEMYYDAITGTFFTYPKVQDVDAGEYNQYAVRVATEFNKLSQKEHLSNAYIWRIVTVNAKNSLETINSPTTNQFLLDLSHIPSYQDFGEILGYSK